MASAAPVALAMGVGYVLGRSHKLRWAVLLGTAAATGRMGGLSTQALERGTALLRSNPELAKLADSATGLLQAGRSAAVSAMSSRAESMTEALGDKAGQLGSVGEKVTEGAKRRKGGDEEPEDTKEREDSKAREEAEGRDEDVEDEYDEGEDFEDEYDEDEGNEDEGNEDEGNDDTDEEEDRGAEGEDDTGDEEEPQPAARGRQSRGSVVRKTGSRR